jgi:hypothetical protein
MTDQHLGPEGPVEESIARLHCRPFDEHINGPKDAKHGNDVKDEIADQFPPLAGSHVQRLPLRKRDNR